jgi:hypothetical protein
MGSSEPDFTWGTEGSRKLKNTHQHTTHKLSQKKKHTTHKEDRGREVTLGKPQRQLPDEKRASLT